jgi:quercetin dioxygenase-like cupin family protein
MPTTTTHPVTTQAVTTQPATTQCTPAPVNVSTVVRPRDGGDASWFLNSLVTTVVTRAETRGSYGISEHLLTAAANPPRHVHSYEDEALFVLEGEIELVVDGRSAVAGPGCFAFVPRGVPHAFAVRSETARMLAIVSGAEAPGGGLERFFVAAGVPAPVRSLPVPAAPDPVALGAIADAHGIVLLPPG